MTPGDESLDRLLARIADGDAVAMEALFVRERASLRRFFIRLCRCEARAEDLLQNTFLNLWRYRESLRGRNSAAAYIYKVALNQWRQSYAAEQRRRTAQAGCAAERAAEPSGAGDCPLEEAERRRSVWRAIESLPEAQRQVFLLHRFEGLSCREIAEASAESVKTVESRLRLGLKKLADSLRPQEKLL